MLLNLKQPKQAAKNLFIIESTRRSLKSVQSMAKCSTYFVEVLVVVNSSENFD
jgi:hypothetical protein